VTSARQRVVARRRRVALAAVLTAALVPVSVLVAPDDASTQEGGELNALPEVGVPGPSAVLMGAAPEGRPGEVWAYQRLPAEVPPPEVDGRRLEFGPVPASGTPDPQLVFLRHTDDTGWQVVQTPEDEQGRAYRGFAPNFDSARTTRRGGGVLLGQDGARRGEDQLVVLRRQPDGRFRVLGRPPGGVLLGEGEPAPGEAPAPGSPGDAPPPGPPAEALAAERGGGRVNVTAYDREGRTALFFVPVGRQAEDAVIANDGGDGDAAWSREPVEAGDPAEFRVAAIEAAAADRAWLVARSPDDGIRLFRRTTEDGSPAWREVDLGTGPFGDQSALETAGAEELAPLDGPAQTLTVAGEAVWIDARVRFAGGPDAEAVDYDVTLRVDAARPVGERVESWCDAPRDDGAALCDHGLDGNAFSRARGYRSFAWPGNAGGDRVVTNPVRREQGDESNRGTFLRWEGDAVRRRPGGGYNFQPSGAFLAPDRGWLGGPVEITRSPRPDRLRRWPVALRDPLVDAVSQPGTAPGATGSGALAVGADGAVARYTPDRGWQREFLLTAAGAVARPVLRGVAWPEPSRAHAVGDLGAMWMWRSDTGLWERDPGAPVGFEENLIDVAFDPGDPERGYAVGKEGTILRYDKSWVPDAVPPGFEAANFTSVAFAGRRAMAVTAGAVLVNDGGGWRVDEELAALLRELRGATPFLYVAAGLPDGGAVVAGRDVVAQRDGPGAPWRFAPQPTLEFTAIAAAAFREGGALRALLSGVPVVRYPVPDPPVEIDPNVPPPILPPFILPGDGYVLRQTATGWRDEQRTAFGGSGNDRPLKSDPVYAFVTDGAGEGWAIGGWSGAADAAGRGTSGRGSAARDTRDRVSTAGIFRYAQGGSPPPPASAGAAPVPLEGAPVRFAVGGHAECDQPCADLANQGVAPDRVLRSAIDGAAALAARPGGPRAFLYTGARLRPQEGRALTQREADRYASLLNASPLPTYAAPHAGDTQGDGVGAYQRAFARAPAPFGDAPAPGGIGPAGAGAPASGGRTHYAFDSSGPGGTVRVVVIDNSAGSLAASDPHQNPREPQLPWLTQALADARARGIPAIVVGNRELNPRARPPLNVASDGDEVARVLAEGGASAYFFDRPEENRVSSVPAGGGTTIPAFGTGTLGYRSPTPNAASIGRPDALFGGSAFLLAEIDVARRDPATNRAPVSVRTIPVLEDLSLLALDGTLLRRSRPSLFQGIGRRPVAGDRWGPVGGGDGVPSPAGSDPYLAFPPEPCLVEGCSTRLQPEFRFESSDPDIGDFVRQDPQSSNLRKPLLGPDDRVVTDNTSGLFCPFNPGTTTVRVTAGGLTFTQQVTVLAGSVLRPCGTRPLRADRFRTLASVPTAVAAPPPPPPPSAPPTADFAPSPPPVPPATPAPPAVPARSPSPPPRPAPPGVPPPGAVPVAPPAAAGLPPVPPPPPTTFFGNPVPPGGATVRVYEQKREEEAAPEQSQAASRYRPEEHAPVAPFLLGAALLAALAGTALRPPRRDRSVAPAYADLTSRPDSPRPTRTRRYP